MLSSVVFLIGVKLIDVKGMREIYRLRRNEFYVALSTAVVVVVVGVEQGIILAIVLSLLLHVRRHYAPIDRVIVTDEAGHVTTAAPTPGTVSAPGLIVYRFGAGVFYANATRLAEEVIGLVNVEKPPRWFVLDADGDRRSRLHGGKTLAELVDHLAERGVVFAVAEAHARVSASSTCSA